MPKLEIRDQPVEKHLSSLSLFVDDEFVDASVSAWEQIRSVDVFDPKEAIKLHSVQLDQLAPAIFVTMPVDFGWRRYSGSLHLLARDQEIDFRLTPDALNWSGPWSIMTYSQAAADVVNALRREDIVGDVSVDGDIEIRAVAAKLTVGECIETWRPLIEQLQPDADRYLAGESDAVIVEFRFPPAVKVACEQYLLYFAEFLADLGIAASAELREHAGAVIFSVTPTNSREALSHIREALDLYLQLPTTNVGSDEHDPSSDKLLANIYHLRSQLMLARAVIQTQQATIRAQETTIDLQRRILTPERITAGNQSVPREEFLGGTLALTRYEGKGFEVNLPAIFRRLREMFKG
ncbi:MAG: hypothetical protein ACXW5U_24970 [Thermoanaerobaculia bacterium]